jgi:hypothetical protein
MDARITTNEARSDKNCEKNSTLPLQPEHHSS